MRRFTSSDQRLLRKASRNPRRRAVALTAMYYNFVRIHNTLRVTLRWPLA